jgi:hypothetical protein
VKEFSSLPAPGEKKFCNSLYYKEIGNGDADKTGNFPGGKITGHSAKPG